MRHSNAPKTVQGAQTIHRTIQLIKLISSQSDNGLKLNEIASLSELEIPTIHRYLKALVAERVIVKNPLTKRYQLGPVIFELGLAANQHFNIAENCTPALKYLAQQSGDTAFIFIRSGEDAVCIACEQGSYPIQTPVLSVGDRQPLGVSAGGLALLAALPEEEIKKLLNTIGKRLHCYNNLSVAETLIACQEAKAKSYALIANRAIQGVCGIGCPIFNNDGSPFAAIAVASTVSRMDNDHIERTLPLLKETAQKITLLLT